MKQLRIIWVDVKGRRCTTFIESETLRVDLAHTKGRTDRNSPMPKFRSIYPRTRKK